MNELTFAEEKVLLTQYALVMYFKMETLWLIIIQLPAVSANVSATNADFISPIYQEQTK